MRAHKKPTPASVASPTPDVAMNTSVEGPEADLTEVDTSVSETPVLDMAAEAGGEVSLGESSEELLARTDLTVARTGSFTGAAAIPPQVGNQLLAGIAAEGVSDATTVEQAVNDYVDEGAVEIYTIVVPETGATFTWLRFTAGDTEVGYIFRAGTTQLQAIVSDGEISPA